MRRRLSAVFILVAAAFVALDVVVLVSLQPQLQRAEELSTQHAASASLIARMDGALHALRTAATEHYVYSRTGGASGDETPYTEGRQARSAFEQALAEYDATPMDPGEDEPWLELRQDAAPAFLRTVEAVMAAAPGSAEADSLRLRALGQATSRVNVLLQQLAEANAQGLKARGEEIHSTIASLVLLCLGLGVLGIVGGVLLVRWALAAVREYERSMEERLADLDEFAGRVAHDLRNPLNAVAMALDLIHRRVTDEQVRATCRKARGSVHRMGSFIHELLVFARSGATPAAGAAALVDEVLRDVVQDLAPLAEEKGVALSSRSPPQARAAISAEALRAIVGNLADNAVKHLPPEGTERRVELCAEADGQEVRISVRDTGSGIPAGMLPRLFEPFFRASGRPGGFGIGLKTVKRLVDAHSGRITVDSEEGRGSVFTVTLPVGRGDGAGPRPER